LRIDRSKNDWDNLVTEQTSAGDPTSDYSPQVGPDQLSINSVTASATGDSSLLALETQFDVISAELLAVERLRHDPERCQSPKLEPPGQSASDSHFGERTNDELVTQQIESILARLYPIERAIIRTPARTIAGLGVKARHAAYVMSQYWEAPLDRIDWDAQATRQLIEAVCDLARKPLPFRDVRGEEQLL
jgi:hypothetical protein